MVSFNEIFKDDTKLGKKIKAKDYQINGKYPIIDQGQEQIAGYTNKSEGIITEVPAIIFGDHTRAIKYIDTPFFIGADGVKVLHTKDPNANYKYLYYALNNVYIPNTGYNRHFKWLKQANINYPDVTTQKYVVTVLDGLCDIIKKKKFTLKSLDLLVKARFVEMFEGNNYAKRTLEEVCINIVDCPHSTPKYEGELLYPAIRTTEIKSGYIDWSTMKYVSKDEYIKRTSRLVPEPGDIVYGREGTYGNAVVLPPDINFCLGQRVMLFRPNTQVCLSEYLLYSILSDSVKQQADAKNVGATVPHVNVADAKKFKILVPPIIKQNEFVYFVHQVDKSKVA